MVQHVYGFTAPNSCVSKSSNAAMDMRTKGKIKETEYHVHDEQLEVGNADGQWEMESCKYDRLVNMGAVNMIDTRGCLKATSVIHSL